MSYNFQNSNIKNNFHIVQILMTFFTQKKYYCQAEITSLIIYIVVFFHKLKAKSNLYSLF